jgi:hypothetical protein
MAEKKIRRSPRLSVNALAQYIVAPAARRERILREQKYPPTFRTTWYGLAARVILRYLIDPERDAEILVAAEERIRALPATGKNRAQKVRDNADAIAAFRACCTNIIFDQLKVNRGPGEGTSFVEGVIISVRPEAVLTGKHLDRECIGGVKLYLSKNDRLGNEGAATIGAMLHTFLGQNTVQGHACNIRHCTVVDVFGRSCTRAPKAIIKRTDDIKAACREIAQRWPTI